ncbi:MAG: hypothetical protein ACOCQD_05495 [archaeon]
MTKQEILIYDEGAEFIGDVFGDDIPTNLEREEFYDYIYDDVTRVGKITVNNKKYKLYGVGSSDALYALNVKSLHVAYTDWCKIIKNL